MCGLIGLYREEGMKREDIEMLLKLIKMNMERGPIAYGIITDKYLIKSLNSPVEIDYEVLEKFIGETRVLIHLRAPTGEGINNLEVTQPIIKNNNFVLFNGILTEYDKDKYLVDTFEVIDNLDYLENLKGSFALCFGDFQTDVIEIMSCINPIYYDNNFFSSVEFTDSKLLKHGELMDFKTKEIKKLNLYNPYSIK